MNHQEDEKMTLSELILSCLMLWGFLALAIWS
jgi:hypothetical protein